MIVSFVSTASRGNILDLVPSVSKITFMLCDLCTYLQLFIVNMVDQHIHSIRGSCAIIIGYLAAVILFYLVIIVSN